MDWTFNGLPMHPLLVHAAVVFVPLTALGMILAAVWPAVQKRLGPVIPLLATITTGIMVLTIQAGEELESQTEESALLEAHTSAADAIMPWIIFMLLAAWAQWAVFRFVMQRKDSEGAPVLQGTRRTVIAVVVGVIAILGALGATWQTYLVGDAGAKSVWEESAG